MKLCTAWQGFELERLFDKRCCTRCRGRKMLLLKKNLLYWLLLSAILVKTGEPFLRRAWKEELFRGSRAVFSSFFLLFWGVDVNIRGLIGHTGRCEEISSGQRFHLISSTLCKPGHDLNMNPLKWIGVKKMWNSRTGNITSLCMLPMTISSVLLSPLCALSRCSRFLVRFFAEKGVKWEQRTSGRSPLSVTFSIRNGFGLTREGRCGFYLFCFLSRNKRKTRVCVCVQICHAWVRV